MLTLQQSSCTFLLASTGITNVAIIVVIIVMLFLSSVFLLLLIITY